MAPAAILEISQGSAIVRQIQYIAQFGLVSHHGKSATGFKKRGRRIFTLIDRHILRRVLAVMLGTIVVGVLVLSMVRMLLVLQTGSDILQTVKLLLRLLLMFAPHYLSFVLPFALFFSTYVVIRRLSLNSELVSIFSFGVSMTQLILPLLMLGFLVTAVNVVVLGWFEPWARYSYRELMFRLEHVDPFLAIRQGVFTTIGNKTIQVERIEKATGTFHKVFVFELGEDGTHTQIIAAQGKVHFDGRMPVLMLRDGSRMVIPRRLSVGTGQPPAAEELAFQSLSFPLIAPAQQFRDRGDDEQEFSFYELYDRLSSPPEGTTIDEMSSELSRKVIIVLSSLFLPLLAASLAQSGPRASNLYKGAFSFGSVIAYQQLIQFGSVMTEKTGLSPALTMWPIFVILAVTSVLLIVLQDTGVGQPIDRMTRALFRK